MVMTAWSVTRGPYANDSLTRDRGPWLWRPHPWYGDYMLMTARPVTGEPYANDGPAHERGTMVMTASCPGHHANHSLFRDRGTMLMTSSSQGDHANHSLFRDRGVIVIVMTAWSVTWGLFCETQWPWPPLFSPSWLIQYVWGRGII